MIGALLAPEVAAGLVSGRILFLIIHILGLVCFAYIVARRLVPLVRAQSDCRFDQPWVRVGRVLKFWLGQWKHPRYKGAGLLHIVIFAGFILLAMRAFTVLIVGVSPAFVMPGLSGEAGSIYELEIEIRAARSGAPQVLLKSQLADNQRVAEPSFGQGGLRSCVFAGCAGVRWCAHRRPTLRFA